MQMPGRKYQATSTSKYRFSINGQEKESELNENNTTALYWEYDSRIGRRWNLDIKPNTSLSPYATFRNNPLLFIDPLGDTTINGQRYEPSTAKYATFLTPVVMVGRSPFPKKVMNRIRQDARIALFDKMNFLGLYKAKVNDLINFTKKAEGQSLGDMLLLSRYQREDITLGTRMQTLIMQDENFQKFEKQAIAKFGNGDQVYSNGPIGLGGDRDGPLLGLVIPMRSSLQTMSATANELTWTLRHVYITATLIHNNSTTGNFTVNFRIEDKFDLSPNGSSFSYDIIAGSLGYFYHDLGGNSAPNVIVDWNKNY
jgi:hypothetical protein